MNHDYVVNKLTKTGNYFTLVYKCRNCGIEKVESGVSDGEGCHATSCLESFTDCLLEDSGNDIE